MYLPVPCLYPACTVPCPTTPSGYTLLPWVHPAHPWDTSWDTRDTLGHLWDTREASLKQGRLIPAKVTKLIKVVILDVRCATARYAVHVQE